MLVGLTACRSKKNISLIEDSKTEFVMPELKSTINVHYKIDKEAINDTFNTVIDSYLADDMELTAMGMDVTVTKTKDANIEFLDKSVLTTLPIGIGLSKSSFLADIEASGVLELNFITDVDIDSSWNLVTKTRLEHYDWEEAPKLSLGGLNLSIGNLANNIIEKSKATFEQQIDASVAEQLEIRSKVMETLKYIETPILVDTLLNSWVHFQPTNIYMSRLANISGYSQGNLTVHGNTKINSEKPNHTPGLKMPAFNWENELDDTSHVNLVFDISYKQINKYLEENFRGQTFENGDKKITLNKINLRKSGEKLIVVSDVSGSVNGELLVSAIPRFDNNKQAFFADDIDIHIKTKNVLHKAGAWMFKSKIKNKLKEMMYFSIADNLNEVQNTIDEQIKDYSIKDQLDINVDLRKVNVNKFVLDDDRIHAFLTLNVFLEAIVHDMDAFSHSSLKMK